MGRRKLEPEIKIANHRASALKWSRNNKEKVATYNNEYYKQNKEAILAKRKARRKVRRIQLNQLKKEEQPAE